MWKRSLSRIVVWLAAEIILNFVGLDDVADYSEYIFERNTTNIGYSYRPSKSSAKT